MTKALLAAAAVSLALAAGGAAAPRATPALPPDLARLAASLNAATAAETAAKDAYDHDQTAKLDSAITTMKARQAAVESAFAAAVRAGLNVRYGSVIDDGLQEIAGDDETFAAQAKHPPKELPQMVGEVLAGAIERKAELVALLYGYAVSVPATAVQVAQLDDVFDDLLKAHEQIEKLRESVDETPADDWFKGDGFWKPDEIEQTLKSARTELGRASTNADTLAAEKRIREALGALDPVSRDLNEGEYSGDRNRYHQNRIDKALDDARAATEGAIKAIDRALARRPAPTGALSISPIHAEFVESARATTYSLPTVKAPHGQKPVYSWSLRLTAVDPDHGVDRDCDNHGEEDSRASTFVWHHGNKGDPTHDDDCDHSLQGRYGHQGVVRVTVTAGGWRCQASYKGTNTSAPDAVALGIASRPKCTKTG